MKRYCLLPFAFCLFTFAFLLFTCSSFAQLNTPKKIFTKADTLRGSNNENRDWWDVLRYDITVKPDFEKKEIEGKVVMNIRCNSKEFWANGLRRNTIQLDLQEPMIIDSITTHVHYSTYAEGKENCVRKDYDRYDQLLFTKKDGVYILDLWENDNWDWNEPLVIYFHGKPREAKKAPWDGGWVWSKDKLGRPFVSVACQGLGASCYVP